MDALGKQASYWFEDREVGHVLIAVPEVETFPGPWRQGEPRAVLFRVYGFVAVREFRPGESEPEEVNYLQARWDSSEGLHPPFSPDRFVADDLILTLWYRAGYDERMVISLQDNHLELNDLKELKFLHRVTEQLIPIAQLWVGEPQ